MRAALTQTVNVYRPMPALSELSSLADQLEELRALNVAHHLELARGARAQGAELICFGELFTGPYFALTQDPLWRGLAEDPLEGPTAREIRAAARALQMVIVAPLYELCPQSGKRFNTALVVDADGEPLGLYRKTHIPNGSNEQGQFSEGFYYERSDGQAWQSERQVGTNPFFPVYQTRVGRVGVAICYDRHFEGVASALVRGGAQLVVSPAVTFGAKSERLWELEFPVDACRHRVFIGGSNRLGSEAPWDQPFFGRSYFVGPEGRAEDLCQHPELVISDLDLTSLEGPDPSGWALARDRRGEIYSS